MIIHATDGTPLTWKILLKMIWTSKAKVSYFLAFSNSVVANRFLFVIPTSISVISLVFKSWIMRSDLL